MKDYDACIAIEREVNKANLQRIQNKKYMKKEFPHVKEFTEKITEYCEKVDDCNCCPLFNSFCCDIARKVSYYVDI